MTLNCSSYKAQLCHRKSTAQIQVYTSPDPGIVSIEQRLQSYFGSGNAGMQKIVRHNFLRTRYDFAYFGIHYRA